MNRRTFAAACLLLAWPLSSATRGDERPNVIIIFCDNLGYGDIEPFGSTVHRTPHLNRMAREGRRFTHFCVTAGVCTPSRSSLITGCYSQRVGMHDNPRDGQVLRPISPYGLHPDELTIAEVVKAVGYTTAMIGKWHLGDQPVFLPTRQGFDWFFGIPYSDDMTPSPSTQLDRNRWPPLPLLENETVIEAPVDRDLLTKRYTERAVEFLVASRDEPFLLYLPQAMPGSTRAPFASPDFKGRSQNGPWGDAIEELDWSTGQILDKLVELKLDRRTFVIWTSDNGAPLARDPSQLTRGSNRPLHGRGYTTGEGAFRVPTIMWWPGRIPAGTECHELATTMDLLPTVAKWAGADLPSDRVIDGHDVTDLIVGKPAATSPYDAFYYYERDQLQAVRSGPWKLFVPLDSFRKHPHFRAGQKAETLLFHVVEDVSCERNVAAEHPDVVTHLLSLADRAREDLGDLGRQGKGQRPIGKVDDPAPVVVDSDRRS